jgi:hypothetical protein
MPEDYFELDHDYEPEHASDNVPWPRMGHTSEPLKERRRKGAIEWDSRVVNLGMDKHRLYSDRRIVELGSSLGKISRTLVEERAFAELWDYYNNGRMAPILSSLMPGVPKSDYERRLMGLVAATLVQWLGTNVGACFVDEARRNARGLELDLWPDLIQHMKLECVIGMNTHTALKRSERKYEEAKRVGRQAFIHRTG